MLLKASLEAAQIQINQHCSRLQAETISILDAAGRVSAGQYLADTDLPAVAQSAVDGYAVSERIASDCAYNLIESLELGDNPVALLRSGQAVRVRTGGSIPKGTIAVVPHEKAEVTGNSLTAREEIKPGNNIKLAGEDYPRGYQLISRDQLLTPADIALLAAFGIDSIAVYKQPRAAILGLSPNVIPWQMTPEPGQTRDCNIPLVSALVRENGGVITGTGLAGVEKGNVIGLAAGLLKQADILILIGGTYTEHSSDARVLMEQLGADVLYWDVPIQPGSHTGAAVKDSRLLFALSGNPAACAVGYQLFVRPAVKAMQGLKPGLAQVSARCTNGFAKQSGSRRFIRGHAEWDQDGWKVAVLPGQKPSMIRSLISCNALIDMPAGSPPIAVDQKVSIWLLKSIS